MLKHAFQWYAQASFLRSLWIEDPNHLRTCSTCRCSSECLTPPVFVGKRLYEGILEFITASFTRGVELDWKSSPSSDRAGNQTLERLWKPRHYFYLRLLLWSLTLLMPTALKKSPKKRVKLDFLCTSLSMNFVRLIWSKSIEIEASKTVFQLCF